MFLLAILLVTLTGANTVSVDPDMELPVRSETEEDIYIFNSMNINPLVKYRYMLQHLLIDWSSSSNTSIYLIPMSCPVCYFDKIS